MTKKNHEEEDLGNRIKEKLLRDSHRLKEKYPPLSYIINGTQKTLQISRLYELSGDLKHLYKISFAKFRLSCEFSKENH